MSTPKTLVLVLFSSFLLSLGGCAGKKAVTDSPNPVLPTVSLQLGSAKLVVELARNETERERGLMLRGGLEDGRGMLFIFDKDERLSFWMKNTTIPLSLAYIAAEGSVRQIVDLVPLSLAPVQAERSVRYALEVPRGWFERAGVKVGDRMDLAAIEAAPAK